MIPPSITVEYDWESDRHLLMASSYGRTEPAGERLLRRPPFPEVQFSHETEAGAQADAEKLSNYIKETWTATKPSKKSRRIGA